MSDLRVVLAQRRARGLLAALRATPRRRRQREALITAPVMCGFPEGWTGGAFDLAILLEDPKFKIPWRSRRETERMVADAKAYVLHNTAGR